MLFNRYKEVTDRCLELGAKMDTLTNEEGAELRRLLEEQAWLSKTIARQASGALEEVRRALESIESWMSKASGQVERALDQRGIPSDILALEDVVNNAAALRDRARNLMPGAGNNGEISPPGGKEYPQGADIRIDFIAGEESGEDQTLVDKSRQEINSATEEVAASTAELSDNIQPVELEDVNKGVEKSHEAGNRVKSIQEKSKEPEPVTFKLSREVVASLEKKLSPELLDKTAPVSEAGLPVESKSKSKKARGRKSKKKKNKFNPPEARVKPVGFRGNYLQKFNGVL